MRLAHEMVISKKKLLTRLRLIELIEYIVIVDSVLLKSNPNSAR